MLPPLLFHRDFLLNINTCIYVYIYIFKSALASYKHYYVSLLPASQGLRLCGIL